jgi:hypothetical protein
MKRVSVVFVFLVCAGMVREAAAQIDARLMRYPSVSSTQRTVVTPDFKVVENPAELASGVNGQLEKAIEVVMRTLNVHPFVAPEQPPYQKR